MGDLALKSGVTSLNFVNLVGREQRGGQAGVDLASGDLVCLIPSSTNAGLWQKADADAAATAKVSGIIQNTQKAGEGLTVVCGDFVIVDGFDLSALEYDADVYLSGTAGKIATTPGAIGVPVGRVISGLSYLRGNSPDKLLLLNLETARVLAGSLSLNYI